MFIKCISNDIKLNWITTDKTEKECCKIKGQWYRFSFCVNKPALKGKLCGNWGVIKFPATQRVFCLHQQCKHFTKEFASKPYTRSGRSARDRKPKVVLWTVAKSFYWSLEFFMLCEAQMTAFECKSKEFDKRLRRPTDVFVHKASLFC